MRIVKREEDFNLLNLPLSTIQHSLQRVRQSHYLSHPPSPDKGAAHSHLFYYYLVKNILEQQIKGVIPKELLDTWLGLVEHTIEVGVSEKDLEKAVYIAYEKEKGVPLLTLLREHGAYTKSETSPLFVSYHEKNMDRLEIQLASHKYDSSLRDSHSGFTILHYAIIAKDFPMADLILRYAPQLANIPTKNGGKPLALAVTYGVDDSMIALLQKYKANLYRVDVMKDHKEERQ